MGKWKLAVKNFLKASKILPSDQDIKQKYVWAIKEERYQKFGDSINIGFPADLIKEELIPIEPSYEGPRLNDPSDITPEWVIALIAYLKEEKRLHKRIAVSMIKKLITHYRKKETIVEITIPEGNHITVCGDVHGQFYDLTNIFAINGNPSPSNPYLFNGDFVDRGSFSIEVMLTLIAWNLSFPDSFFLNRGNHESVQVNKLYG